MLWGGGIRRLAFGINHYCLANAPPQSIAMLAQPNAPAVRCFQALIAMLAHALCLDWIDIDSGSQLVN